MDSTWDATDTLAAAENDYPGVSALGHGRVSKELLAERAYREEIEATLASEVDYRTQLKADLDRRLEAETAGRGTAEALRTVAQDALRDERERRKAAEETLGRTTAERDDLRERVQQLDDARAQACDDLATERQSRRAVATELEAAQKYAAELETLYRAIRGRAGH